MRAAFVGILNFALICSLTFGSTLTFAREITPTEVTPDLLIRAHANDNFAPVREARVGRENQRP